MATLPFSFSDCSDQSYADDIIIFALEPHHKSKRISNLTLTFYKTWPSADKVSNEESYIVDSGMGQNLQLKIQVFGFSL